MILLKNKDKKANIKIGNNIEIKDGNDFPFDLTLYGKSTQATRSGKNLLKNTTLITETTKNGITATPNEDGSIILNGTSTGNCYFNLMNNNFGNTFFDSVNGGSTEYIASTSNSDTRVRLVYDSNNKWTYLLVYGGNTLNNFVVKPMIRLASITDDTYEPYGVMPSPDYPSPIESIGRKNLFNKDNANIIDTYVIGSGNGVLPSDGGTENKCVYIPCKQNTTYTIQKMIGKRFGVAYTYETPAQGVMAYNRVINNNVARITITTDSSAKYLVVYLRNGNISGEITLQQALDSLQIEQGTVATDYVPYEHTEISATVTGKNLYKYGDISVTVSNSYYKDMLLLNNFEKNTTYVLSFDISSNVEPFGVSVGYGETYYQRDVPNATFFNNKNGHLSFTFTVNDTTCSNLWIRVPRYKTPTTYTATVSNIMLEKGSVATDYEEYKSNSLTIDLQGNELCSLPNGTKDEVNITNGEALLIKRVGKVVLDGSESGWTDRPNYNSADRFVIGGFFPTNNKNILSNYFTKVNSLLDIYPYILNNDTQLIINFSEKGTTTLAQFKTWLSTHNVEVLYELAEPKTVNLGTVEMPHTYEGVSNITNSADTEMVVKYYKKFEFDKILRSGYNIDEQEYEIAKKQMANGKRKKILSSYVDCIIKIDLGLLDNKTYQEYKEQLEDGEYEYWSYKYNQYKKANFILTKPSITTEYAYDDEIGIDDMEITLEKSSDVS